MKYPAALAGVILGTFVMTESAHSLKCERLTPAQHIDNSGIIFYGQLIRGQHLPKKDEHVEVEFEVLRAYKGAHEKTIHIQYYNDDGGYFGWGFRVDQPTLIFAGSVPAAEGKPGANGLGYYSMSTYHARPALHQEYRDILNRLKPQVPGKGTKTTTEQ